MGAAETGTQISGDGVFSAVVLPREGGGSYSSDAYLRSLFGLSAAPLPAQPAAGFQPQRLEASQSLRPEQHLTFASELLSAGGNPFVLPGPALAGTPARPPAAAWTFQSGSPQPARADLSRPEILPPPGNQPPRPPAGTLDRACLDQLFAAAGRGPARDCAPPEAEDLQAVLELFRESDALTNPAASGGGQDQPFRTAARRALAARSRPGPAEVGIGEGADSDLGIADLDQLFTSAEEE
jgi:hypothetical protein